MGAADIFALAQTQVRSYMCSSWKYSSGQNKVNVPFAFRFRATVLAFKRNAKRALNGCKKDATKSIRFDIVGRNLPFYGKIDMCARARPVIAIAVALV